MDTRQINQPLKKFIKAVSQKVAVDEVIVFGSRLEGNAREDSDIDVIVVSDDFKQMTEDDRLDLLYKASAFIEPEIHPWAFTADELNQKSELTTWGHARTSGFRFI